ncbi:hypothetical protein [Halomarina oriensis]|uniref:Uncharacterized protein n=1 Tax=Halomarina oriensis TaxID=671145 RepID=A0A6B0GDU7_9EURY|nr:hypothetical protein [Halomarina oriensis]MWG32982.1 hypothetical protein [Halomarina oriensis]
MSDYSAEERRALRNVTDPATESPNLHRTTGLGQQQPAGASEEWLPEDVDDVDVDAMDDDDRELSEEIIEAIERPKQAPSFSKGYLPVCDLPGFGDAYPDCGDDMVHFCEDCGHTSAFGRTCRRSECPRCAPAWARNTAKTITGKLIALRSMLDARRETHQRFHHLMFSPSADWTLENSDPLKRTVKVIKQILSAYGVEGVWFYHPYRGDDSERELDDRGFWKQILGKGLDWDDVKDRLEYAPHFHVIVVGHHIEGSDVTKRVYEETDWILHRIHRDNSSISIPDDYALARAVSYCLSHTGVRMGYHDNGRNSNEYQYIGDTLREAQILDKYDPYVTKLVRRASVDTLGLSYNDFDCRVEREVGPRVIDMDSLPGFASKGDDDRDLDAAASTSTADQEVGVDDVLEGSDQDDTAFELRECTGTMSRISTAHRVLDDPEWDGEFADDLRDAYEEWLLDDPGREDRRGG